MARFASAFLAVFCVICLLIAFQGTAWGYVDPGTGFVALQTFASVLAAGGYFLRRRIRGLFGKEDADEKKAALKMNEEKSRGQA